MRTAGRLGEHDVSFEDGLDDPRGGKPRIELAGQHGSNRIAAAGGHDFVLEPYRIGFDSGLHREPVLRSEAVEPRPQQVRPSGYYQRKAG